MQGTDMLDVLRQTQAEIAANAGSGYAMMNQMTQVQRILGQLPMGDSVITGEFRPEGFVGDAVTNVAKVIARLTETEAMETKRDGKDIFMFIGMPVDVEAALALTQLTARVITTDMNTASAIGLSANELRQHQRRRARMASAALRKATVGLIAAKAAQHGSTSVSTAQKRTLISQSARPVRA